MDKVSVIMPCYNSEKYVADAIQSVLNQTHQNLELLICDDSSTDGSLQVIKKFVAKDSRVQLFGNAYLKGAPGARNTCLDAATGDFISFLDADDLWLEDKLEKHIEFMVSNDAAFSYSHVNRINEDGGFVCVHLSPDEVDAKKMCFANFIPCSTAIFNSHVVGHIHQPNIEKRNDFALWLKILNSKKVRKAYCFKEVTSSYRANTYGLSSNKVDAIRYYHKCLTDYNNCSKTVAFMYLFAYIPLILLKQKFPSYYNVMATRFF
ncbi:glycosyltransferase [Alphaproteobacteria bacterium]|nr:glycosyltransferase [Alphaproteobacteria bacterium]MDB2431913.1 glycosyltransferase [Alphaproteobacteria bacterium]MDB2575084.1 glycosyltransferase [Alphaproteobacteria bacterium]MDB2656010.1 glycosyltransferase [Alphaproteobacteria bacterium]